MSTQTEPVPIQLEQTVLPGDARPVTALPVTNLDARDQPTQAAFEWGTVRVLWKRDLVRFFRQKSRVVGALVQPLLFWTLIGSGFSGTFRIPGAEGVGYMQYFFPGIVLMVILFTSIFSTMSLIEDRREGFMQAVLSAPGSRVSIVMGKTLGASTIAFVQAMALVVLAPVAGFGLLSIDWLSLLAMLILTSIGLTAIGFAVAWWLNSVQGYHAVMSVLLIPLWMVSGAMFPFTGGPGWLRWIMLLNPLGYAASGIRRAFTGGELSSGLASSIASKPLEFLVTGVVAMAALAIATAVCNGSRTR